MGRLTAKERELVALGAALGSNCVPCVVFHVGAARKAGLEDEAIAEAVALADRVRKTPAEQVLRTAYARIGIDPEASPGEPKRRCGC